MRFYILFYCTAVCSGLSWDSMKDVWSNRRIVKGNKQTVMVKCPVQKDSIHRDGRAISKSYVQESLLEESIDMVAGQLPMGSHEQWKDKKHNNKIVDVQYVVSLRDPYAWFISSIIDITIIIVALHLAEDAYCSH